ncbi:MAG: SRPBCC family protein [Bdellovibrionaceae bacterium]|nr:SRPBCC family protein [Pseudobdellovibrionaceae bacterium]
MAGAQTSEVFNCTPEQFYKIVADYESYPQFLTEVKGCKVLKTEGNRKLVEYSVQVVKNFKYSLWMTETPSSEITWEFAGGDIFKTSSGKWKLTDEGGKCRAHYEVEATFNMFVPGPIAKALVNVNLPNMIAAYQKRVSELYG